MEHVRLHVAGAQNERRNEGRKERASVPRSPRWGMQQEKESEKERRAAEMLRRRRRRRANALGNSQGQVEPLRVYRTRTYARFMGSLGRCVHLIPWYESEKPAALVLSLLPPLFLLPRPRPTRRSSPRVLSSPFRLAPRPTASFFASRDCLRGEITLASARPREISRGAFRCWRTASSPRSRDGTNRGTSHSREIPTNPPRGTEGALSIAGDCDLWPSGSSPGAFINSRFCLLS